MILRGFFDVGKSHLVLEAKSDILLNQHSHFRNQQFSSEMQVISNNIAYLCSICMDLIYFVQIFNHVHVVKARSERF